MGRGRLPCPRHARGHDGQPIAKGRPRNNLGTVPIFPTGKWDCPPPEPESYSPAAPKSAASSPGIVASANVRGNPPGHRRCLNRVAQFHEPGPRRRQEGFHDLILAEEPLASFGRPASRSWATHRWFPGSFRDDSSADQTSLASIQDMRRRSLSPTSSTPWSRSRRRMALKPGALALFSRIHSRAKRPS